MIIITETEYYPAGLLVYTKLMQSNRPQVKFCFKSDSNGILIDFFDPISAAWYTRRDDSIQIWIIVISKESIYIKNWNRSNSINFFNL